MPKKTKTPDPVAVLSEAMVNALESLRQQGGDAYPPTLRRLAELCDGTASDEQILKALNKQVFKSKAVAIQQVDRKPTFDSPVYFKPDVPPPEVQLAQRMVVVLESQKRLGDDAYPPTLGRLAELCGLMPSNALVPKAAAHMVQTHRAVAAAEKPKGKPSTEAPIALKEDFDQRFPDLMPALLRFALSSRVEGKGKQKGLTSAFPLIDLPKKFALPVQDSIGRALEEGIERQDLPGDVAWVEIKGVPNLFLIKNLRPGVPQRPPAVDGQAAPADTVRDETQATPERPARDFAEAFREAFEELDRRNGATNFVKLSDLRRALPEFGREAFDAGLRALRKDGLFTLDSHEGLYGSLTPDDREAGVREAGSLLIYASRR